MQTSTLYLIQSDYSSTAAKLDQLQALLQSNAHIVLMGDSVLHAHHPALQQAEQLFVLDPDAALLGSVAPQHVQVISYPQFAEICLAHTRCMTIK